MKQVSLKIATGLGDALVIRIYFDTVKHEYDQINISHITRLVNEYRNASPQYFKFLNDIGNLLFTEPPYTYSDNNYPIIHTLNVMTGLHTPPKTPTQLSNLLCRGNSLNIGEKYVVITTKIRGITKKAFYPKSIKLWKILRELSQKYKIVILGERIVEKNREYTINSSFIFGIYDQIIANIPPDRILDLTIPALGIEAPNVSQIQQDCLIHKEAEFCITYGLGGSLWMALASANKIIGYRDDQDKVTDSH